MTTSNTSPDAAYLYDTEFYKGQMAGSVRSAFKYVDLLAPLFQPASVVDMGCGRGTWLKAFKERGATRLVGYDGSWNNQANMVDSTIEFRSADLNKRIPNEQTRFDLAMSLEVAEHLQPPSSEEFVRSLTGLADVVLFGAAFTDQGGTSHINEQPHSFWAGHFARFEYAPFDLFRPVFWADQDIEYWYRQNTFLYVKKNTPLFNKLTELKRFPIEHIGFMDCVHPALFQAKLRNNDSTINQLMVKLIPQKLRPFARQLKRLIK